MNARSIFQISLRVPKTISVAPCRFFARNASSTAPQHTPRQSSPWTRRLIYAGIFGGLGAGAGSMIDRMVSVPPKPGSAEDKLAMEEIQHIFDIGLPIVQELRNNPNYVEAGVYGDFSEESKTHRLTSGPLSGSKGIALQRVFSDDAKKETISVVYLGNALEGWPTMVHGGALGTVLDENMGRAALRHFPAQYGVTANMNINYRAPVYSGNFYTFYTQLDVERSTDRKAFVACQVRDQAGNLCAESTGIFVVPKKFQLPRVGDGF